MFFNTNHSANFEDSTNELWTDDEILNPLEVNRLGYRDNTETILDFIRSGNRLVASREGYLNDRDNGECGNFFEETSFDLDNLNEVKQRTEAKVQELSTSFSTSTHEPTEEAVKSNTADSDRAIVNPVENTGGKVENDKPKEEA